MNDKKDYDLKVIRPFGPSIARIKMPDELIENLNNYIDKIVLDTNKAENLNHGNKLAGHVTQEFKLENDFVSKNGWWRVETDLRRYRVKVN